MIGQGGMVLSSRREGSDWMSGEVLYRKNGEVLEQAAQSGCGYELDRALGSQVWYQIGGWWPCVAGGLEFDPWGPFQSKPFWDSMISL